MGAGHEMTRDEMVEFLAEHHGISEEEVLGQYSLAEMRREVKELKEIEGKSPSEQERLYNLRSARETFPDFDNRFGVDSFGEFEASDRIHIIRENMAQHVCEHPAIALCPKRWALAHEIFDKLDELFQLMNNPDVPITSLKKGS